MLCGSIYRGDYHFSTCPFNEEVRVWQHDGRIAQGNPWLDTDITHVLGGNPRELARQLTSLDSHLPQFYIYTTTKVDDLHQAAL